MAHGHRKPAIAKTGSHFVEGSLLPPDPMRPFGEAVVHHGRVQVRVPFAGVEPTALQLIDTAETELRRIGVDLPDSRPLWTLRPRGSEDSLEFDLVELVPA